MTNQSVAAPWCLAAPIRKELSGFRVPLTAERNLGRSADRLLLRSFGLNPNPVPPLRRSARVRVRIPVTVTGMLRSGAAFKEETYVVSVSKFGAKLRTDYPLDRGMEIRLWSKARSEDALFHVVWVGREDTLRAGEVGIQYVKVSNFLGVTFPE